MKTLRLLSLTSFMLLLAVLLTIVSCSDDDKRELPAPPSQSSNSISTITSTQPGGPSGTGRIASVTACNAYTIALEDVNHVGNNYEWIWTVQNPNPGNGNNGTVQNLSHWGMQLASCVPWSSVVGAAYSADGITWTSFTPVYQVDPSQNCMTQPVLKFNFGTVGSTPSYYKLIVNQNFSTGYVPGYYKSGSRTGCCIFNFVGIGCPSDTDER